MSWAKVELAHRTKMEENKEEKKEIHKSGSPKIPSKTRKARKLQNKNRTHLEESEKS